MSNFTARTLLAMKLAKEAGQEIKKILKEKNIEVKRKGLNDVVTIADTKSETLIIEKIQASFKEDTIIAEESGRHKKGSNEYSWAIDPLDGTMNYSRNIPYYCVSIGYLKNDIPEGGAIYIPETDELYFCERGKGAYCNDEKICISNIDKIEDSLATIGFNNRYIEVREAFNAIHKDCMNKMQNVEKLFSTVISLCYVASGRVEAHFELYCFLWDICVGALLVEEAGGKCTTLLNKNIDYTKVEKQIILASNNRIHDDFTNIISKNL